MKSKFSWLLHFPLTKIVIALVCILGLTICVQLALTAALGSVQSPPKLNKMLSGFIGSGVALYAYYLLFKFYEKRKITELSAQRISFNLGIGILLGALLQSLTILVIALCGGFRILAINPVTVLLSPFIMAFTSAILEEVTVRGVVFRILEEKLGTMIALVISAIIFGALHLGNPNSSLLAATGLALQAGVFLAAAYVYTRNLWFPIAIHFAWNFTQAGIFGASVSGGKISSSLLTTSIQGNTWITGGAFGPEGSLQATLFCLTAAVILLVKSKRKGSWIEPYWKNTATKKGPFESPSLL